MTLKSLKLSKTQCGEGKSAFVDSYPRDEYPYGTRLDLQDESLDALGIKELPEIGSTMMIGCKVKVIGARQSANEKKTTRTLELQITDMDFEIDEDEVGEQERELARGNSRPMNNLAKKMKSM